MHCIKCGAENDENAAICCECSALLPKERKSDNDSNNQPIRVRVVDIEMSFMAMVTFIVKLTFAAIPAAIIIFVLSGLFYGVLTAMLHR